MLTRTAVKVCIPGEAERDRAPSFLDGAALGGLGRIDLGEVGLLDVVASGVHRVGNLGPGSSWRVELPSS